MKNVCVFCSSSNNLDESYSKDAKLMGKLIAENGYDLIYGGSYRGLMGDVALSAKEHGSTVYGIMPKKIYELIKEERGPVDKFILTETLRERKEILDLNSDAIIALAGGFGTLDEIIEMLDLKLLSYNGKPLIFLNTNGYYNKLIEFFEQIISEKFANEDAKDAYYVAQTPEDAINYIKNYKIPEKYLSTFKN